MSITIYIAFAVWPFVVFGLFGLLGPRRGTIASLVGGFLFLPYAGFATVDGLPSIEKNFITSGSALAALLSFDPGRLTRLRWHWLDAFVLCGWFAWSVSPLANGLGIQQALLDSWFFLFLAVVPYLLGRMVVDSPAALRDLAVGIVMGTTLYALFALVEMRMSPQFNRWVYGLPGAPFHTAHRWGGWRPRVFQYSGLGTAMWMCAGAVVAVALAFGRVRVRLAGASIQAIAAALVVIGVLCKGAGAASLMALGLSVLVGIRVARSWTVAMVVPALVALYILTGVLGSVLPIRTPLVQASEVLFGPVRAGSLEFRFRHEEALVWHAMKSPVFGWGGWGRNLVEGVDAQELTGRGKTVPDGFWVIALGKYGLLGLAGTYGWMLVPAVAAMRQVVRLRAGPELGFIVSGLVLWITLTAADLLLNGFIPLVLGFVGGGLASFVSLAGRSRLKRSRGGRTPMAQALRPARLAEQPVG